MMFSGEQRQPSHGLLYMQYNNLSKAAQACPCACDTKAVMQDCTLWTTIRLILEVAGRRVGGGGVSGGHISALKSELP